MPRLLKENCCDAVAFAVREYDPSNYGAAKRERIDLLALLRHNVAIAALRHWARRTRWPPFRTAARHTTGGRNVTHEVTLRPKPTLPAFSAMALVTWLR